MSGPRQFLVVAFTLASLASVAQYFQYTQYNFSGQRINPASIGLSRYASASILSRRQRTGGDFVILSNFFSAVYPLLNSSTGVPWSAVGITLHDDRTGGIFTTQEIGMTYALHIQLRRFQRLSLGAKALFQTKTISYDNYFTGSQYVPDRGFDLSRVNGENFTQLRNSLTTFSMGLHWQKMDKKGRILQHAGISMFDLNKPDNSFVNGTTRLPSTLVADGGFQFLSSADAHWFSEYLVTLSGSSPSVNAGIRFQKELNIKPKKRSDRFELFAKYAVRRSGIIGAQFHKENFSFGLSYDFPVLVVNPGNVGAIELGLELRKLVSTRAQKLSAKRKKADKSRENVAAKKIQSRRPKPIVPVADDSVKSVDTLFIAEHPKHVVVNELPKTDAHAGDVKHEPMLIEKITLHFSFDFNSYELDDETENFLTDLSSTMQENEYLKLRVTGHTDNIGSDKSNLKLSERRADVIKHHLMRLGISPVRILTEGRGMREPLNENATDEDRAKNRRVEISIIY